VLSACVTFESLSCRPLHLSSSSPPSHGAQCNNPQLIYGIVNSILDEHNQRIQGYDLDNRFEFKHMFRVNQQSKRDEARLSPSSPSPSPSFDY